MNSIFLFPGMGSFGPGGSFSPSGQILGIDGTIAAPTYSFASDPNTGLTRIDVDAIALIAGGVNGFAVKNDAVFIREASSLVWSSNPGVASSTLALARDANDVLAQRRGTNPQAFNLYNTFTDASNKEYVGLQFAGNEAQLLVNKAGSGSYRSLLIGSDGGATVLKLRAGGVTGFTINASAQLLNTVATGGIGYGTGAGGTVTQLTSKATTVILNTVTGQITLNAAALAAATIVTFTLTNSAIAAGDLLVLQHISGGTAGAYTLNAQTAAGSATINVRNATAGSLSEAIVISFAVIKGAVS